MKEYIQFWPQILSLVLFVLYLLKAYFLGGQEKTTKVSPFNAILRIVFEVCLVTYGGFYVSWHLPQVLYTILMALAFIVVVIVAIIFTRLTSEQKTIKHKISTVSWTDFIGMGLLFWGGYFNGLINFINQ